MSVIALETVKLYLRVTHSSDDALLQALLNGAEAEAMRFMNRAELPGLPYTLPADDETETDITDEADIAPDVVIGVALLVACDYDADPDDRLTLRRAAETKLQPYRAAMGC